MEEKVRAAGSSQPHLPLASSIDRRLELGERPLADLVKSAISNVQEIVRSEVRLARAEVKEEVKQAGSGAGLFAAGGVLALYALGFLLAGLMLVLALFAPVWLAALVIGFLLAIAAGILLAMGRYRWKRFHPFPEKTAHNVKENVEWLRNQTR